MSEYYTQKKLLLNDSFFIKQSKRMTKYEMEPLYWIVEDAIYDKQPDKAKSSFELLSYAAIYNPNIIKKGLKQVYLNRLQQIAFELFDSSSYQTVDSIDMKYGIGTKELPFKKESELESTLCSDISILRQALKDDVEIFDRQVITDGGFKCDIVAQSKNIFYPIELKITQADHRVVSQINKYCFYFYRRLRYDRYKDIKGVVIAPGFDSWAVNELRKFSILIFDIEIVNGKLSLRHIY